MLTRKASILKTKQPTFTNMINVLSFQKVRQSFLTLEFKTLYAMYISLSLDKILMSRGYKTHDFKLKLAEGFSCCLSLYKITFA